MMNLFVHDYLRSPLVLVPLEVDTFESRGWNIARLRATFRRISHVLSVCCQSQVLNTVIQRITINVIQLARWPFTVMKKPSEMMGENKTIEMQFLVSQRNFTTSMFQMDAAGLLASNKVNDQSRVRVIGESQNNPLRLFVSWSYPLFSCHYDMKLDVSDKVCS